MEPPENPHAGDAVDGAREFPVRREQRQTGVQRPVDQQRIEEPQHAANGERGRTLQHVRIGGMDGDPEIVDRPHRSQVLVGCQPSLQQPAGAQHVPELEPDAIHGLQPHVTSEVAGPHLAGVLEADLVQEPAGEDGGVDDESISHGAVNHGDRPGTVRSPRPHR